MPAADRLEFSFRQGGALLKSPHCDPCSTQQHHGVQDRATFIPVSTHGASPEQAVSTCTCDICPTWEQNSRRLCRWASRAPRS